MKITAITNLHLQQFQLRQLGTATYYNLPSYMTQCYPVASVYSNQRVTHFQNWTT